MDLFYAVFCPLGLKRGTIYPTYGLAEHTGKYVRTEHTLQLVLYLSFASSRICVTSPFSLSLFTFSSRLKTHHSHSSCLTPFFHLPLSLSITPSPSPPLSRCAVFVCTNGVQRLCVDKAALEKDRVVRLRTLPENTAAGTGLVLCCTALYCAMLHCNAYCCTSLLCAPLHCAMLHFADVFCVFMVCNVIEHNVERLDHISLLSHYIIPEHNEVSSGKASSHPGASTGINIISGTVTMVGCGKPQESIGLHLKVTHTTSHHNSSLPFSCQITYRHFFVCHITLLHMT
jgi:hypothetical protein